MKNFGYNYYTENIKKQAALIRARCRFYKLSKVKDFLNKEYLEEAIPLAKLNRKQNPSKIYSQKINEKILNYKVFILNQKRKGYYSGYYLHNDNLNEPSDILLYESKNKTLTLSHEITHAMQRNINTNINNDLFNILNDKISCKDKKYLSTWFEIECRVSAAKRFYWMFEGEKSLNGISNKHIKMISENNYKDNPSLNILIKNLYEIKYIPIDKRFNYINNTINLIWKYVI